MLLPIIIAGGTGSRLWPMSREFYPKQFLNLYSNHSMLQETVLRLEGLNSHNPIVICNEEHRFLVAEQMRQINKLSKNIILEPVGRNTAPAIALAALSTIAGGEDPILLVLAADHVIKHQDAFHQTIRKAIPYAHNGNLVTFGIVPCTPETGYGYIQRGINKGEETVFQVHKFIEKPDKTSAKSYIDSGEYYWNSGIFLFRAKKYLSELGKYYPDILSFCKKAIEPIQIINNQEFIHVDKDQFINCPNNSIDYVIMEKTTDAIVVALDAGWSDVGSWSALWEVNEKDTNQNSLTGDVFLYNTSNCYINTDEKIIAAIGLNNLVIVNTRDAILIVDKDKVQDVKKVVEHLKIHARSEYQYYHQSYRSWGRNNILVDEINYKVNYITVKPGGMFSLHMHHHRTEHWIVLSGIALVTVENTTCLLNKNQSTFVPIRSTHQLKNPGISPLEILEIQSGSYISNDDVTYL